ncbi:hypothetical protein RhiirA4_531768 [Rhizophagus irregularis]|uniref:Uncharacterized protein n=1 Tax=Rhizophagus irregularis TaxID=588596 RepID=A0A2I1GWJ4_9GLOM|nr:hypothetical protein RhiirA4_531768 [Rhizophagus irregularis]
MAQVSNDYTLEAFSGYIDVLINFMVPLLIFLIVDYEYESKTFVRLSRSLVFFINVAIQQELAFIFSSFKVSNFVKILQHIVFGLLGIEIIGNFIIFFITKKEKTEPNPLDNLEKKFEKRFKGQIYDLKETLKEAIKTQNKQIQTFKTLENSFKTQIQTLKQTLEDKLKLQIQTLKQFFDESIQIFKNIKSKLQNLFQFYDESIQTLQQFFNENIETQIQTLNDNVKKNFLSKKIYEPKFQILEKKVKTLEQKVDPSLPNHNENHAISNFNSNNSDTDNIDNIDDTNKKLNIAKSKYDKAKLKLDNEFKENLDQEELKLKEKLNDIFQDDKFQEELDDRFQDDIFQEKLDDRFQNDIFQEKFDNILQEKSKIISKNFNKAKIFIEILRLVAKFTALTFFGIILCFLLNDLKGNITQSFVISSVISASLIFIMQFTILIIAYRRKKLKVYIKNQEIYNNIVSEYYAYFSIIEEFVSINVLYLPSLINYFLLQTPNIFNKIFLNLSALLVTVWIIIMYKSILKNEGMNEEEVEEEEKEKSVV